MVGGYVFFLLGAAPRLARRNLVAATALAATALTAPNPAHAGFGPSGGAVISDAPLKQLSLENLLQLSPGQLKKRTSSLSIERARELVLQLEANAGAVTQDTIDDLAARIAEATKNDDTPSAATAILKDQLDQMRESYRLALQKRELQRAVEERERLLTRLAAQPPWIVYGAAVCASFASTMVMHPVDTFKTLKMSGMSELDGGSNDSDKLVALPRLYAGLSGNLLKEVPPSAVYLGIYELIKDTLLASKGPLATSPLAVYLISGAIGEFVGSIVRAPSEAAKTLVQSGKATNTVEAFGKLFGDDEMRASIGSTWFASVLRDVPFGALQIAVFESLKTFIVQSPDISFDSDTILAESILGAIGGCIGAFVSAPVDIVVTKLISQERGSGAAPLGPLDVAGRILDDEGPLGFFKGSFARVLYWSPAIGIFLGVYCTIRKFMLDYGF